MILLGSPYSSHTLSLNNTANPSTDIFSIVEMKCTIFVSQLHTTRMESYFLANGNFTIKSAVICIHGFSGAVFGISFPAGGSVLFLFL